MTRLPFGVAWRWISGAVVVAASLGAQRQFVERELPVVVYNNPHDKLALGDVDADGDIDFVCSIYQTGLTVLKNDGGGRFVSDASGLPTANAASPALGDFDRDGDLDIVVATYVPPRTVLSLWLNDGRGVFRDVTQGALPPSNESVDILRVADVDGDGALDIVASLSSGIAIYQNRGNATFVSAGACGCGYLLQDTGDLNRDGRADVLVRGGSNSPVVFLSRPGWLFSPVPGPPAAIGERAAVIGDVDRDGDADVLSVAILYSRILLNDGTGRLSESIGAFPAPVTYSESAELGDLDEDGDLDAFVGNGMGFPQPDQLYLNDGRGRFVDVTWSRLMPRSLGTGAVGMADLDGDGDLDLVATYIGPGPVVPAASAFFNGMRDASFEDPVRIGQVARLGVAARRGFASSTQAALVALSTLPMVPPVRISPFGDWRLDPRGLILLDPVLIPAPTGVATIDLLVPPVQSLYGQVVSMQALVAHDVAPSTWRFTGVARASIAR